MTWRGLHGMGFMVRALWRDFHDDAVFRNRYNEAIIMKQVSWSDFHFVALWLMMRYGS
jgi:hypothetical protein